MRKRMIRKFRKNVMRLGTIHKVEVYKTDEDGKLLPKKHWSYCIDYESNGKYICSIGHSLYSVWQGADKAVKWANEE